MEWIDAKRFCEDCSEKQSDIVFKIAKCAVYSVDISFIEAFPMALPISGRFSP